MLEIAGDSMTKQDKLIDGGFSSILSGFDANDFKAMSLINSP